MSKKVAVAEKTNTPEVASELSKQYTFLETTIEGIVDGIQISTQEAWLQTSTSRVHFTFDNNLLPTLKANLGSKITLQGLIVQGADGHIVSFLPEKVLESEALPGLTKQNPKVLNNPLPLITGLFKGDPDPIEVWLEAAK